MIRLSKNVKRRNLKGGGHAAEEGSETGMSSQDKIVAVERRIEILEKRIRAGKE